MKSKRKYGWLNESPLKPETVTRDHVAAIQELYLAGLSADQIRGQMIALGYFSGASRPSSVLNFIKQRIQEIRAIESGLSGEAHSLEGEIPNSKPTQCETLGAERAEAVIPSSAENLGPPKGIPHPPTAKTSAPTLDRRKPVRAEAIDRMMELAEIPKRKSGGYL